MSNKTPAVKSQVTDAEAAAAAAVEADAAAAEAAAKAQDKVKTAYVVAVNGDMLNLFTNVWLTKEPKKVKLDEFILGQLAVNKLEIVPA